MKKVVITGTGHSKFGHTSKSIGELMKEVTDQAIKEAKITINNIDAVYISNFSSSFNKQCHLPAIFSSSLTVNKEIVRVESACASGGLAIKEAVLAILSGLYKVVLVVGVEKMTHQSIQDVTSTLSFAGGAEERRYGATFPSLYALIAQRYFYDYGATETHLAQIAVKNHNNALLNPNAHFHKKITIDNVLNSKIITSPLKLLDCSPISDGAAAVVICNETNDSKSSGNKIYLKGIGHEVGPIELFTRTKLTTIPAAVNAAQKAYKMSGINSRDIDVAEIHDCFTIAEIIEMEDLGFCEKGKAKNMINEGKTNLKGLIPINPSGGLKAKGHPIGATGVSQVVEIFKQLNCQAGARQVKNAEVGLTCNLGGSGSSCVVGIFSK